MFNYVNTLHVGKSTGANTGTTLPTIAAGDILFLNGNTSAVLTEAQIAALSDTTPVVIASGIALGVPRLSAPIRRRDVTTSMGRATREPFRAAAQQVDEITFTFTAGKRYRLIVVLKDEFRFISNRQTKLEIPEFTATGDNAADLAKLAARVTKFKGTYGLLEGSVVGGKLRITGKAVPTESIDDYQFVAFSTAAHELEDGASQSVSNGKIQPVVTLTKAQGGSGLPVQLKAIERMASGYRGNNDLRNFDRPTLPSQVDSAASYDLIHIVSFDKHQGDHEFTMESPVQTTLATNSGSTLSTFVEGMVDAWLTKTGTTPTASGADLDDAQGV